MSGDMNAESDAELRARTGEDNLENAFVKIIGSDVGLE